MWQYINTYLNTNYLQPINLKAPNMVALVKGEIVPILQRVRFCSCVLTEGKRGSVMVAFCTLS